MGLDEGRGHYDHSHIVTIHILCTARHYDCGRG